MQFRLIVEYDGSDFHGWQLQPDERTVQEVLESAIERLLGHRVRAAAAGRTDAGVHADGQVVCFATSKDLAPDVVRRALNANLPEDVAVRTADVVPDSFDARRSASSRVYTYRIWNRSVPSPFWRRHAWHVFKPLDLEAMSRAAARLTGEHDFSSFRAADCDAAHAVRRVLRSRMTREGELLFYEIEATAFLRHMVRNIVGTLVEVGRGRRSDDLATLLALRDRTRAGATAPPHGLCLREVRY